MKVKLPDDGVPAVSVCFNQLQCFSRPLSSNLSILVGLWMRVVEFSGFSDALFYSAQYGMFPANNLFMIVNEKR